MGKIAANRLAAGDGWSVADVVCTSGPQDRSYEEQHGAATVALVMAGSFQYRAGHAAQVMSAGSVLLGAPGQIFECRHDHGTGDRCFAFAYTPEFVEDARITPVFKLHRIPPLREITPCFVQASVALRSPATVDFEELAHGVAVAVLDVADHGAGPRRATASDERRVSSIVRLIEANVAEPLPLQTLASAAGMSAFHFLRVFKQITGVTPHQYILRSRLRAAALRLKCTRAPVLDIALDCGFRDLSNFNHAFRAEFGRNPTQYRA